ncbi:D-alanyl-D-alanine carboxypeptidase family protein [Neobacillus vireti]|uniref:D-alanyl-D-alanine carboxypeptidase n=1 Tax=Neobacillus vireti LMG 21834 TaxID=1131730 RepID=A0AB94IUQ1_9BACI|nr:D-alanyl-D-alanine carboxypeptidase family protein [Neobacillus vireti]ETI70805.1 D-alanyl-D-alanine carboxypeptidase [Neobacillus vireti LMG 21834]KLT17654.1 D-Ala-D-Ala carboxypeptidase [Neobacillus vireti]
MKIKNIMFLVIVFMVVGFGTYLKDWISPQGDIPQNSLLESMNSNPSINGEAALLLDVDSGKVIYAKNDNKRLFPASTTKILTAFLAVQYGNLNDQITVGKEINLKTAEESSAYLYEGQVLTLRELLAGLMLPSGNDAARTIAIYTAKKQMGDPHASEKKALDYFVSMMNKKAKEVGATDSHFMNPHGLHHSNHYSTAHDLALIAREAMKNPQFKEVVSSKIYSDEVVTFQNKNKLLDSSSPFYFEGANGIKTGFTDEAGYCLVSSAERNGKKLIAVVLKSTANSVWNDSISLLANGFTAEYVKK